MRYTYYLNKIEHESYSDFCELINKMEKEAREQKVVPYLDIFIHSDGGCNIDMKFFYDAITQLDRDWNCILNIRLWAWCSAAWTLVIWLLEAQINIQMDDNSYLLFHIWAFSLPIGHGNIIRWELERAIAESSKDFLYHEPIYRYLNTEQKEKFEKGLDVILNYQESIDLKNKILLVWKKPKPIGS